MKRYLVSSVITLLVLAFAWAAFGQGSSRPPSTFSGTREDRRLFRMLSPEEAAKMREKWQTMSEEEKEKFRAEMREKWENMSEEERQRLRSRTRGRFGPSREDQLSAIKVIEEQLAKLKAGVEKAGSEERPNFREMTAEQRAEYRQKWMKMREEQQNSVKAILAQVVVLQGRPKPAEDDELVILNMDEIKTIYELAVKEKAEETAQRLERIGRGREGFGGRRQMPRPRPDVPGGSRGPRVPDAPSGQQEQKTEADK